MQITLSFATTADGYLDDNSPRRLMISTPEDWEAVLRLRASHDAILAGAETLRRDDPALLLRDAAARELRRARGMRPDLTKVTLTHSGRLSPSMRFFTEGDADRYVFSEKELPELKGVAEVISSDGSITASAIVTELEKRGVERLLVEGGASVLRMFLAEGMADTVRRAVNPQLTLGPERGGAQFRFEVPEGAACRWENLGGMEVATCTLRPDTRDKDLRYLAQAVAEGLRCVPSRTSYCVGAVVALPDGRSFTGYTHETSPTHRCGRRIARGGDLLLDGAVLAAEERAGELHAADPAPRIRTRGLCAVRTRPVRPLPRGANAARSGGRRAGLSRTGRRRAPGQRPPREVKRA